MIVLTVSPSRRHALWTLDIIPMNWTSIYNFWHIVNSYMFVEWTNIPWEQYEYIISVYLIQIIRKHYYHLMQRAIWPGGQVEYFLYELSGTRFGFGGLEIWEYLYRI